jgi:hypothetical protein
VEGCLDAVDKAKKHLSNPEFVEGMQKQKAADMELMQMTEAEVLPAMMEVGSGAGGDVQAVWPGATLLPAARMLLSHCCRQRACCCLLVAPGKAGVAQSHQSSREFPACYAPPDALLQELDAKALATAAEQARARTAIVPVAPPAPAVPAAPAGGPAAAVPLQLEPMPRCMRQALLCLPWRYLAARWLPPQCVLLCMKTASADGSGEEQGAPHPPAHRGRLSSLACAD